MKSILAFGMMIMGLLSADFHTFSQTLFPHPVPEEFVSDKYRVSVNGQQLQVFHAGLNIHFVSFDFTGDAQVLVSAGKEDEKYAGQTSNRIDKEIDTTGYWKGNAIVRPLSDKLNPITTGSSVTFTLKEAGQFSVEVPGTSNFMDQVLFIFANKPEVSKPLVSDPNVIFLNPGIHIRNIDLKSNQTLYLDAGAILFGSINIWDASNVKISGRGTVVYCGPQSTTHDDGWKNLKNWHPLTSNNCKGLYVEGVTFIGRSRTWTIQMHTTFDAVYDNVKVFGINPQNVNGDGFDWFGGGRAIVKNCFVRSADDCFAFFTPDASLDMWSLAKNTTGEVKDIYIENCVLWSTLANVYRLGFNGQDLATDNIVMKNCDVIHIGKGEWMNAPWAIICAISTNNKGKAFHSNYLFEDVRFEEPTALLGLQNEEAKFKNFVFKNVTMTGELFPSYSRCEFDGLTLDNVKINGKLISGKSDLKFKQNPKEITKLRFSGTK